MMLALVRLLLVLAAFVTLTDVPAVAQEDSYRVPRTVHGHPDFQGVWATEFLYLLERPTHVEGLVATPQQARAIADSVRQRMQTLGNIDPDVFRFDIWEIARVQGEYRTSVIVDPPDGRMPYTEAARELAVRILRRNQEFFDVATQRPLNERCMEALAYPPVRAVPVFLPRQIFQTREYVAILAEDANGLRVIRLDAEPPPDALRSVAGYSTGHWEGDTLVVRTTGLRDEDPARHVVGRPLLLSRDSRITERFTRVSPTELFYQFTVEDAGFYHRPWTGEFSLTRHEVPIFEYGCHEGNYSLPLSLVGGQAQAARAAASPDRD